MRRWGFVALFLFAAACNLGTGSSGTGRDGGPSSDGGTVTGTTALFEVPRGGVMPTDFFALPFPNDLRLKADGLIDLSNFPPGKAPDVLATFFTPIGQLTKHWSLNAASYFRF